MAVAAEDSPPERLEVEVPVPSGSPSPRHCLSCTKKIITSILNMISSNKAPPPPMLPISSPLPSQQQPHINDLRGSITKIMQEQELGRLIITLAVPMAAAVLMNSGNCAKLMVADHVLLVGLMMGCVAIWNGILFRTNFPRLANALEQVGISLVLLSLCGLVAFSLPKGVSWILWLSGAFCLVPFILARLI